MGNGGGQRGDNNAPCLYCGESKPKTDEHVLQKGLGGSAILKNMVCGDCNTKVFSPLDGVFVRTIQDLLCMGHPDISSRRSVFHSNFVLHYEVESSCWITLRLDRDFGPRQVDQISYFPSSKQVRVHLDSELKEEPLTRLARIKAELSAPADLSLSTWVEADCSPPVEQAIIRSAPRVYLLRAASEAEVQELRRLVEAGLFASFATLDSSLSPSTIERPLVRGTVPIDIEAFQRACAKTAMNVVALAWGLDFAQDPAFDTVKAAILSGRDIGAFVELVPDRTPDAFDRAMAPPRQHTVSLSSQGGALAASFWFYQRPTARVILTHSGAPGLQALVGLFNYVERTHRLLSVEDLAKEARSGSPRT